MKRMNITPAPYWQRLAPGMFPTYEEALGEANKSHFQVIATLDFLKVEEWFEYNPCPGRGRPKLEREIFLRAFIAKVVLNIPTNVALIDRLQVDIVLRRICGFITRRKIPCEATFSNAFEEFSASRICEKMHEELVKKELQNDVVFHISRDSSAIQAREKTAVDKVKVPRKKRKRGRPAKGTIVPQKTPTRIERQLTQSLPEMKKDLAQNASYGMKRDSHGNNHVWCGYKLHLDIADGGIPISCILTTASAHDSGASIPLQHMSASRVKYLYLLADKAYDSRELRENIRASGQVPIIPEKKRRNGIVSKLENFETIRFKERSTAERANSVLKDRFGARQIFVKGYEKVMCHLMFGVLVLFSETITRL
jgi:IS5 family transposase